MNPRVSRETPEDGELLRGRARELGLSLAPDQIDLLRSYGAWLAGEGVAGGVIGPNEARRVLVRHVLEGLAYVVGFERPPARLLDVGSGGGIPGVPLAIAWPACQVTLLERSGRKADLLRRGVRVLGLTNTRVRQEAVETVEPGWPGVVMRAVFPPPTALTVLDRLLLAEDATGVVALGEDAVVPAPPPGRRLWEERAESEILAPALRLLIMAPL